eukprot:scaffold2526_cov131-Cylindrotheca_fusiformis.AAC.1
MARRREIGTQRENQSSMPPFLLVLLLFILCRLAEGEDASLDDGWATERLWSYLDEKDSLPSGAKFSEITEFGAYGQFDYATCAKTNLSDCTCKDSLETCEERARRGECKNRYQQCPKACLVCQSANRFEIGEKQEIPARVLQEVEKAVGRQEVSRIEIDQSIEDVISKTASIILKTQEYMASIVMKESKYQKVRRSCQNYDSYCSAYAAIGYCEDDFLEGKDYSFMMTHCAPACQKCDDYELLQMCYPNQDFNIFEEGDLDRMFRRMVGEGVWAMSSLPYKPIVHSRPGANSGTVVDGPWIVTLVDFLTDDECQHLISLGKEQGYKQSSILQVESTEEYRTSVNSWCIGECANDPVTRRIIDRISKTTGIPQEFSEPLQMLQYMPGQQFKEHHDVDHDSFEIPHGPRLLTFFLYLNDVKEGGATRMVDLDYQHDADETEGTSSPPLPLDIVPRKGMALVWPNLNDEDLTTKEERTWHAALPVIHGMKYGANAWYRIRRFVDECNATAFEAWKLEHRLLA